MLPIRFQAKTAEVQCQLFSEEVNLSLFISAWVERLHLSTS